jgi:hypothetical protein
MKRGRLVRAAVDRCASSPAVALLGTSAASPAHDCCRPMRYPNLPHGVIAPRLT